MSRTNIGNDFLFYLTPKAFSLAPNYPNPFSGFTILPFYLQKPARVRLSVMDITGREVAVLVDAQLPAGRHEATWQAGDSPAALYFWRLETPQGLLSQKMVLIR